MLERFHSILQTVESPGKGSGKESYVRVSSFNEDATDEAVIFTYLFIPVLNKRDMMALSLE